MYSDNCVELFIDILYIYNANFTKTSYSVDSSMSFANESQKDLLKCFTNPFAWDQYGIDQWYLT